MKNAQKIFIASSVLVILLLIITGKDIFYWIVNNWGYATLIYSVLYTLITYYYAKNENFYLFIHKYVFFWFKNYNSRWKFENRLICISPLKLDDIKSKVLLSFKEIEHSITKDLRSHLTIIVDDEIKFQFDIIDDDEGLNLEFRTSKFTVPWNQYEERISFFINLFNDIAIRLKPQKPMYQISLYFEEKNPYFGFFIRYLPYNMVTDFNCQFASPRSDSTFVKASKDRITIDSSNTEFLRKSAFNYLTLNDTIVTKS